MTKAHFAGARSVVLLFASAVCFVLLTTTTSLAQGTRGTIRGQVTDPNGAVVSGASIKLIDVARNQEIRAVQTDEDGDYQFLELEPATYNIVIVASGFAETRLNDVKVEPNRNLQLDAKLALGTATADVTVTGTQELLDKESPTLGTTVDTRRVVGLPLNGRNVLDLVLLQPGVTNSNNNQAAGSFGAGSGFRVNGQRGVENNITLDGSNNNEVAIGGTEGAQPRPDAVQEFRVLTSNFEAEFGRNTGSIVNVVTKSGTNEYHGNLRFFIRPTVLSAARFFDKALPTSKPRPGTLDDFRRRFERKEFGGQIGGPIYIPRFGEGPNAAYSGKNKAFFFIDYEGRRQLIGNTQTVTGLPTALERAGNFSALTTRRDCNNNGVTTDAADGVLCDPSTRAAFPNATIPLSRFSPIALYYLGFMPVADATGTATAGANQILNNNYLTARVDVLATGKQTVNFTFNRFDSFQLDPFAFGGATVPGFASTNLDKTYNAVLRHTYTFTPNLVNSLLIGYARNDQPGVVPQNQTTPQSIGFSADFVANQQYIGPPQVRLSQRGLILGNSIQGPQARVTTNAQLQDSVSWATGNHRFKFGVDGTKYFQDQTFLFINQGVLTLSRTSGPNTTGDDLADLLIGNTPGAQQYGANGLRDFRQFAMAAFGQDTWRFNDSLTLSLGLRWEFTGNLYDKANRVAYYRTENVTSQLLTSGQLKTPEGIPITVPTGGRAPLGLVFVGDPDPALGGAVPRGGAQRDLNNFAPRVGFAYAPKFSGSLGRALFGDNRDTVIRGGFGVYYGAVIGDTFLQQLNAPGFNGTNAFYGNGGVALSSGTLANPFGPDPFPNFRGIATAPLNVPAVTNPFAQSQLTVGAPVGSFPGFVIDPHIRTPYTYQYNLTYERGFLKNYVLDLSYVGNRGRKLYGLEEVNPALGTFFPARAGDPVATPNNLAARRANRDIPTSIDFLVTDGNSWFNAFEVDLQRRYSNGLLFQIAYTFSKSLNDVDTQRGILDKLDRKVGKARSSDDVPHRLVASFIYDLPITKTFGWENNGAAKRLLDGWSFGGIYTYQSGTPFSVLNAFDELGTSGLLSFADLNAPFQLLDPLKADRQAFNKDAFKSFLDPNGTGFDLSKQFRRGSSGRNMFRAGNTINNWDLILSKKTRLWSESTGLELRFEAFNAFNKTQFTTLNTTITSATFGKYTAARESRVIQLGARFTF